MLRAFLCIVALVGGFAAGWRVDEWRHASSDVKAAAHTITVTRAQGAVSTTAAAHDAQVQTEIRYVTRTLVKEVPVVLPPETDRRFPLPVGFVRLHDAAALGLDLPGLADPAGRPDDAASAVAASAAAEVVVANYGECRADQARLSELQDWLRQQGLSR